ncbi:MAG: glycerol kinase GlpK [Peptococcaceae bacterium]|nr:glycerol kinase GlpK [Peptococcaceae bacterium]
MSHSSPYILVLDQGTTSSRALVFNMENGAVLGTAQQEISQSYPRPGWVEQDAAEIWETQRHVAREALRESRLSGLDLRGLGIANQRETIVLWDACTGRPLYPAIVWQCRRSAELCEELREDVAWTEEMRRRTGLVADPYFSGTKISWLLRRPEMSGWRARMEKGDILVGTIDTWLLWNMTRGGHDTDTTNASRTLLFNIHDLAWDDFLLEKLGVPQGALPQIRHSTDSFGETCADFLGHPVPITGVMGDQQAALLGHGCIGPGMIKNTYGTGCFLLANMGAEACLSEHGLLTTVAWSGADQTCYALEGSVFAAGSVIQWLKQMGFVATAGETQSMALSVPDTDGVMFVPAFTGLGSPYWDAQVRGTLLGVTQGTRKAHIVRAALEAVAFQNAALLEAVCQDGGFSARVMSVDGGVAQNDFLMQFQADIMDIRIERPASAEVTAWGAACAAALGSGIWENMSDVVARQGTQAFVAGINEDKRKSLLEGWQRAVACARLY